MSAGEPVSGEAQTREYVTVHIAAPVIEGARDQWCIACGTVLYVLTPGCGACGWPAGSEICAVGTNPPWIRTLVAGAWPLRSGERHCIGAN